MFRKHSYAVVLLVLLLVGCKDPYGASAKAGSDIAAGITQGLKTIASLNQQGLITNTEAVNAAGYLEYANRADEAFLTCISTAHTSGSKAGSFTTCAQTFNTTLNNPTELTLIHVNNSSASQTISTIVNGVTTGVSLIITNLGGA